MNILSESNTRRQQGPSIEDISEGYETDADAFSLANLIQTVWANRWLLVATTAIALGVSAWQLKNETRLYTTAARVVLKTERVNVVNIESVVPQRQITFHGLNTEIQVLRASELMERVVAALSLEEDPEFNPALRAPEPWKAAIGYERLRAMIGLDPEPRPVPPPAERARKIAAGILTSKVAISILKDTFIFNIKVTTEEPQKSATIANTIGELYVASQREMKFAAMDAAMTWLGTRVVELKAELEAAEAAIENFSSRTTLVGEETLTINQQRLKGMRMRAREAIDAAVTLSSRVDLLASLRSALDFTILAEMVDEPRVAEAAGKLALAQERDSIAADDPRLDRFDAIFEPWLGGLRSGATRWQRQVESASRSVKDLETLVDAQSSDLVALRQMEREAEATSLIYGSFLGRLKEITVQLGIQQADSRILSRAGVRDAPSHPNVPQELGKNGSIGLLVGFFLIFARNALRRSVLTPEDLEAVAGYSVLGVIPDYRGRQPSKLLDRFVEQPNSGFAEAVRDLRTSIQLSNIDAAPKVIAITSSVSEEGKSILASTLALSNAMAGKKVLLIDSDLRRKVLRRYFLVDAKLGLVSLLSGETTFEETVHHDKRTGLDFLFADDKKVTPVDFFGSQQFCDLISEMRDRYDLIFLDTPPVLAVSDARVIAQQADAVIYAVRWNSTTRRMIRTGLESLRQANVHAIGLALNKVDPKRMDLYGYYGYGYGAGSGNLQKYYSG